LGAVEFGREREWAERCCCYSCPGKRVGWQKSLSRAVCDIVKYGGGSFSLP
jgi:hypothetical protein